MRRTRTIAAASAVALSAAGIAGVANANSSPSAHSAASSGAVALLLPENKTARYESQDRPLFTQKLKQLCPKCKLIYANADQDASKQQSQAEAALTQGAKVLVLDPVDAASAASIVNRAKQSKVPVVSYDRLISNAPVSYYVSFDNQRVGQLQATALTKRLKQQGKKGSIVMINGAPTDSNAALFKKGAHGVIDKSGLKVAKEYDTPDWSPDQAQTEMEQAITALGKNGFVGVYAANDGTAGGAIAAMKSNGVNPKSVPVTGQDAELAGIQRILAGEQYMTIYKASKPEASAAAQLAVSLVRGTKPPARLINKHVNNGQVNVPSVIFQPVVVTRKNVKSTVVKDRYWKTSEICTGRFAAGCKAAGIS